MAVRNRLEVNRSTSKFDLRIHFRPCLWSTKLISRMITIFRSLKRRTRLNRVAKTASIICGLVDHFGPFRLASTDSAASSLVTGYGELLRTSNVCYSMRSLLNSHFCTSVERTHEFPSCDGFRLAKSVTEAEYAV